MNPLQVIRNEFFHKLGNDYIAVDPSGTPIARSTTRASVEQAAPSAAAYFSAADFPDPASQPPQDNDHVAPGAERFPEPVKLMPSAGLQDTPKPVSEPIDKAGVDTRDLCGNGPHTDTPTTFSQFSADPPVPVNPALASTKSPTETPVDEHPDADKFN